MDPWTQILDRIWYYLEEGPASAAVTQAIPPANRGKYGPDQIEPAVPTNSTQPVLIVDQTGGDLDLNYSPRYLRAREEFQITLWADTLALSQVNDLRLKVLAALEAGLPNLGLDTVLEIKFHTGQMTLALDKVERDADGRLMQWRWDLRKARQRAVLLELNVTFLIDRTSLST